MIDEQCLGYGGAYRDKRLALWQLEALPFFRRAAGYWPVLTLSGLIWQAATSD